MKRIIPGLDRFTQLAKDLRRAVRVGDSLACDRARAVFRNLKDAADVAVAEDFGLMRAQHVVAVEHGCVNWADLRHYVARGAVLETREDAAARTRLRLVGGV